MQDFMSVMGMVLKTEPIGEYDRRVVILTNECGKISVFAKGARRQNNRFMASMNPFCFGEFKLFVGRNSYSLADADISYYFEELRSNYSLAYYGMYFLEIADYYTRENNDEREMLKLLLQSMRALVSEKFPVVFIRHVFELKAMMVNGEFPEALPAGSWMPATAQTVEFIRRTPIQTMYTFQVSDAVLAELKEISRMVSSLVWDKQFKALELLEI